MATAVPVVERRLEKQAEIAIVIRIGLESDVVKEESTC
jgi:hypothetical protein